MSQGFDLEELTALIDRGMERHRPMLVALDGPCASGKTTLAGRLQAIYGCALLHMDDFFLPAEKRTPLRLSLPGGNVDWERFLAEGLLPLSMGRETCSRPWLCRDGSFGGPVTYSPGGLVLVEGAYSLHPALREHYHLRIFLQAPWQVRHERLLAREGEAGISRFLSHWIPMEKRYFSQCGVRACCQLVLGQDEHFSKD